jgi:predicted acetyltransferase
MTMTTAHASDIGPARDDAELAALFDILSRVFNFPREYADKYCARLGREHFRVLRAGGRVAGGLAQLPMAQFYGGRSIAMTGIAVVGVAPDVRSRGGATGLMRASLAEMHAAGIALSVLYPATWPLYRRVGYELAGSRYEIKLPLRRLHLRERGHEIRAIAADDQAAIATVEGLYRAVAVTRNGYLDRSGFIAARVRAPRFEPGEGYLAVNPATGAAEGYVFYKREECDDAPYELGISDLIAVTPEAGLRLLTFLADHRSMAAAAVYYGLPCDPFLRLLPERGHTVKLFDHWMLRLVHVRAALAGRGYPAGLTAEVHLDVADDILPGNAGKVVLQVANGRGQVAPGGRGDVRVDVRGLAALYSGHATPWELRIAGQLAAAEEEPLRALASVFAGPAAATPDFF